MATHGNSVVTRPFLEGKITLSDDIVTGIVPRANKPIPTTLLATWTVNEEAQLIAAVPVPPDPYAEFETYEVLSLGLNWFDMLHILPRRIDAGNILTTQVRTLDIYNAFLYEEHDLEAFINNAGAGTNITDLPSLPYSIPPLKSLLMTLEITPDGAPTINTTLDFDTDEPYLLSIPDRKSVV